MSGIVRYVLPVLLAATLAVAPGQCLAGSKGKKAEMIYTYKFRTQGGAAHYDEVMAVTSIQGIVNRDAPTMYLLDGSYTRPQYWLDVMSRENRWLQGRERKELPDLDAVARFAGDRLQGAVIWDPAVPASLNVANTIAGVEDAVVMSPEFAEKHLAAWKLPVIRDLRGLFTGKETGSAKNDAYRWAIREYLAKGRCSAHFVCLYMDSFGTRDGGDTGYVEVRDWAVKNRAFVYDLSPWGDETPTDDLNQPLGTDLATYKIMLEEILKQSAGKQLTEVAGFFNFSKYSNQFDSARKHEPVYTEWETVRIITPYNCYQNTATERCFNQSFHCHAPMKALKQHRPAEKLALENRTYLAILMADYDSAFPLYHFMPGLWDDKARGQKPVVWGINPNLIETYPDIIAYFYETASPNDYFVADASAAGYMNPNLVPKQYHSLFVKHNKRFYEQADVTISGMVLDWDEPRSDVKDLFTQFSPDGFATIVVGLPNGNAKHPDPQVWKGMPVIQLHTQADFSKPEAAAKVIADQLKGKDPSKPGFFYFRSIWTSPSQVNEIIESARKQVPDQQVEVVDLYTFFDLFKQSHE